MEPNYIVVSQDFFNENNGYRSGVNVLNIRQTTNGSYVTSKNALEEFPELFALLENEPQEVYLVSTDFPTPPAPAFL